MQDISRVAMVTVHALSVTSREWFPMEWVTSPIRIESKYTAPNVKSFTFQKLPVHLMVHALELLWHTCFSKPIPSNLSSLQNYTFLNPLCTDLKLRANGVQSILNQLKGTLLSPKTGRRDLTLIWGEQSKRLTLKRNKKNIISRGGRARAKRRRVCTAERANNLRINRNNSD